MALPSFIILFTSLFIFYIGLFIFLQERSSSLNKTFFLLSISMGGLVLFNFVSAVLPVLWTLQFQFFFGALMGTTFLHFAFIFCEGRMKTKYLIALYSIGTSVGLLSFSPVFIKKFYGFTKLGEYGLAQYEAEMGWGLIIYLIFSLFCYLYGIFKLVKLFKSSEGARRIQTKYILAGLLVFGFFIIFFELVLPVFKIFWGTVTSGPSSLFFLLPTAWAVWKYRLFTPKETFRSIFETMVDSVAVTDLERRIALFNRSLLHLLGYKKENILGESIDIILGEGGGKELLELLRWKKEVRDKVLEFIAKDGTKIPVSLNCSVIRRAGEFMSFVIVARDIRERLKYEKESEKAKVTLEEKVRERTRELEIAKKSLEESKGILEIKVHARTAELEELTRNLENEVKKRTKELQERVDELERFRRLTVGRELKMIEMKKRILELEKELKSRK